MSDKEAKTAIDNKVYFHDTTLRDGVQSLWAMKTNFAMFEAINSLIDDAGYISTEPLPPLPSVLAYYPMLFNLDPWAVWDLAVKTGKKVPLLAPSMGMILNALGTPDSPAMFQYWWEFAQNTLLKGKLKYSLYMCGTKDEVQREFPYIFPALRSVGIEPVPYIAYFDSPRHTDEFYSKITKEIADKYKPVRIVIKDVDGLLTPERAKTLIPVMTKSANGIPLELHSHGMSGYHEATAVEAMKQGVRRFQTCIPPLASGSSHISIFNVAHNARVLGLDPQINEEPLRIASERLFKIAKEENLPIGAPELYDERVFSHKVPGGVISNLRDQLNTQGMADKLDEVLDEIPRIIKELGYPVMITPQSQWIVTQATLNVAAGERWSDYLDAFIEMAVGVHGTEDQGPQYMDQNLRDKLLSDSKAKKITENYVAWQQRKDETRQDAKKRLGWEGLSDIDFWNKFSGANQAILDKVRATPVKHYAFDR